MEWRLVGQMGETANSSKVYVGSLTCVMVKGAREGECEKQVLLPI